MRRLYVPISLILCLLLSACASSGGNQTLSKYYYNQQFELAVDGLYDAP